MSKWEETCGEIENLIIERGLVTLPECYPLVTRKSHVPVAVSTLLMEERIRESWELKHLVRGLPYVLTDTRAEELGMKKYRVTHDQVGTSIIHANDEEHARDVARPHLVLALGRVIEDSNEIKVSLVTDDDVLEG